MSPPDSALNGFRLPASMLSGLNQERFGSNELPGPSPLKTLTRITTTNSSSGRICSAISTICRRAEASVPITQTVVIAAISRTAPITITIFEWARPR